MTRSATVRGRHVIVRHRLIVNADDFGLASSVSQGIIEAHQAGHVTSTTLMVNTPGTDEAVGLAEANKGLGVGLHFNLTEGRPLTDVPSLVDTQGNFLLRRSLLRRSAFGRIDPVEVAGELEAQLNRFSDLGLKPTHMDSHEHVHMAPPLFRAMEPVLRERVSALRVVEPEGVGIGAGGLISRGRELALKISARLVRRRFGGITNARLVSVHQLGLNRAWSRDSYRSLVESVPANGVTELMVHPFAEASDLVARYANDPIRDTRLAFIEKCRIEHRILTSSGIFEGLDVVLCNYRDLV